jgi:UDP-N-acetylmuramoylalanine--D-glutamate ligase
MSVNADQFKGKRVTVMGLGRFGGGAGAARFFASQGAEVTVTDLKAEEHLAASVAELDDLDLTFRLGEHVLEDFTGADAVCVSPAVKPGNRFVAAARDAGVEIVTAMGLFFELFPGRIIGVTGSNGKSTTTALTYAMLAENPRVHLGGNIGRSLLPQVGEFDEEDVAVLELSSFQLKRLDHVGRSPETAIVTNISPNHLDWHPDFADYAAAKAVIAKHQRPDDTVIFADDDEYARRAAETGHGRRMAVSFDNAGDGVHISDAAVTFVDAQGAVELFAVSDVPLPGTFNLVNSAMAAAAAFVNGAPLDAVRAALGAFEGLEHRLQFLGEVNEVKFYNDSVSTTPESTVAAREALAGNAVFILGGYDKGVDLLPAVEAVVERCSGAVFIGRTGPAMAQTARQVGRDDFQIETAATLEEAVRAAYAAARTGGAGHVVLSPACASYDMFTNFEHRGNVFAAAVKELIEREENDA